MKALASAGAAALMAIAALPAGASAGTVDLAGGEMSFSPETGESNRVQLIQANGIVRLEDNSGSARMAPTAGCTQIGFNVAVQCPADAVKSIRVELRDGDDRLKVGIPKGGPPVTASGGDGMDRIQYTLVDARLSLSLDGVANDGPLGSTHRVQADFEWVEAGVRADTITGSNRADRLIGLNGKDKFSAGRGNDFVDSRDYGPCPFLGDSCEEPREVEDAETDTIDCGTGVDTVDGDAFDKFARSCEYVAKAGVLALSPKNDRFTAFRTGLVVRSGGGNDTLTGSSGGLSVDTLDGGSGRDDIDAGVGNDRITGGSGRDHLRGGPGNDRISARDGQSDNVNCGVGEDTVTADRSDKVSANCESVKRR